MNKYFRSAAERFDKLKGRDFLINPISSIDCEIIIELGQILKKAGLNEVIAILGSYKEVKDQEICDQLMQFNIDNPSLKKVNVVKQSDKLDEELPAEIWPVFFQIGEITLHESDIRGYKTFEKFDSSREDYIYGIILNPMPEGFNVHNIPMYANEIIEFLSEENRNIILKNLSGYLKGKGIDILDLSEDE